MREALVVTLGLTVIVLAARAGGHRLRRGGAPGWGTQLIVGLGCGVLGALVAAAPHADLVPDGAEFGVALGTTGALALVAVQIGWRRIAARRTPRSSHQAPRLRE